MLFSCYGDDFFVTSLQKLIFLRFTALFLCSFVSQVCLHQAKWSLILCIAFMSRRHRSAEDIIDSSCNEPSVIIGTSPVVRRKNQQRSRPPALNLSKQGILDERFDPEQPSLSPLLQDSNCVVKTSSVSRRTKVTNRGRKRPVSLFSPLTSEALSHVHDESYLKNSTKEVCTPSLAGLEQQQNSTARNNSRKWWRQVR